MRRLTKELGLQAVMTSLIANTKELHKEFNLRIQKQKSR
jgi:hypothetical protein